MSRRANRAVNVDEARAFFRNYVFGFMEGDLKREIWLARKYEHDVIAGVFPGTYPGGSNLLAALGLLSYTETLGGFMTSAGSEQAFRAFFVDMGPCYAAFEKSQRNPTVYNRFRNGLAHKYDVEGGADFLMVKGREACGIGVDRESGRFFFVVEQYFEDFQRAARRLYKLLTGDEGPPI